MKKLLFLLITVALFACERKADPREAVILEFLNKLKTEKASEELLHSKYFPEKKFTDSHKREDSYLPVPAEYYLTILQNMKTQLNESDDIKVMTYAEAQLRSIEVPTITDQNTDNIFVIQMGDKYAFCVMDGDKIDTLMPLWKVI